MFQYTRFYRQAAPTELNAYSPLGQRDAIEPLSSKRYPDAMQEDPFKEKSTLKWTKRFGVAAFLFFLIKGLLWLIVPAVIAYFALN
jgi:hypothetical protein